MSIFRCPQCHSPYTEGERSGLEKCTTCSQPFQATHQTAPPVAPVGPASEKTPARPWMTNAILPLAVVFLALTSLLQVVNSTPRAHPGYAEEFGQIEQQLRGIGERLLTTQARHSDSVKGLEARLDQVDGKLKELSGVWTRPATLLQSQSEQLSQLETRLEALTQRAFAPPAPPGPLDIRVITREWGDASSEDVQAVCVSAAKELWAFFPHRRLEPITVGNSKKGPMAVYGRGSDGERRILINIDGKLWARCAYQFSHEFCHVLCNSREAKNPNLWFEESLCEAASLFALRRMAKTWKAKPPYPNWKSYSDSLDDYADVTARAVAPLENLSFADWFVKNQPGMRKDGTDRPHNRVVALSLLKLLDKDPHHWEAVGYLNQWDVKNIDLSFADYLADWFRRVPDIHKPFVKEVGRLFKIEVK